MPQRRSPERTEAHLLGKRLAVHAVFDVVSTLAASADDRDRLVGELADEAARLEHSDPLDVGLGVRLALIRMIFATVTQRVSPTAAYIADLLDGTSRSSATAVLNAAKLSFDRHSFIKAMNYPAEGDPVPIKVLAHACVAVVQVAIAGADELFTRWNIFARLDEAAHKD